MRLDKFRFRPITPVFWTKISSFCRHNKFSFRLNMPVLHKEIFSFRWQNKTSFRLDCINASSVRPNTFNLVHTYLVSAIKYIVSVQKISFRPKRLVSVRKVMFPFRLGIFLVPERKVNSIITETAISGWKQPYSDKNWAYYNRNLIITTGNLRIPTETKLILMKTRHIPRKTDVFRRKLIWIQVPEMMGGNSFWRQHDNIHAKTKYSQ